MQLDGAQGLIPRQFLKGDKHVPVAEKKDGEKKKVQGGLTLGFDEYMALRERAFVENRTIQDCLTSAVGIWLHLRLTNEELSELERVTDVADMDGRISTMDKLRRQGEC